MSLRRNQIIILIVTLFLFVQVCNVTVKHFFPQSRINVSNRTEIPSKFELRPEFTTENINTIPIISNFIKTFEEFPWQQFEQDSKNENVPKIWDHISNFILLSTPYLIKEPVLSINESCRSPPLRRKSDLSYKSGDNPSPKKVGILIQLGFDVDTLEIHLNELWDVTDKFFIVESTHTHGQFYRKPLIWERVKYQGRFRKFLPKIVHIVVDDAQDSFVKEMVHNSTPSVANFESETLQETLRWWRFLQWNNATGYFKGEDLIGFGDCDEIANRETVNYLKHCIADSDPIDVGSWFPFGALDTAYKGDWAVKGHPFTIGDPTFWTLKSATNQSVLDHFKLKYPTRNRGISDAHILGGIHMSHYGYLPFMLMKRLTASESSHHYLLQFKKLLRSCNISQLQTFVSNEFHDMFKAKTFKLEDLDIPDKSEFAAIPWFYKCNAGRYPAWEGRLDPRLD